MTEAEADEFVATGMLLVIVKETDSVYQVAVAEDDGGLTHALVVRFEGLAGAFRITVTREPTAVQAIPEYEEPLTRRERRARS